MADDKKPFSSPFERLQALKGRLPKARRMERPPENSLPSPPRTGRLPRFGSGDPGADPQREAEHDSLSEDPPENPEADFSKAMSGLGVAALAPGKERILDRPPGRPSDRGRGPVQGRSRRVNEGLRGAEDGFDASTPLIDLHGMSVDNALSELRRHVAAWRRAGLTRARIITGRGSHSGDGVAAIRDAVEAWLRDAPGAVGVYRGRPGSGGEGVVFFELSGPGRKG